jgi:hypothetical protein
VAGGNEATAISWPDATENEFLDASLLKPSNRRKLSSNQLSRIGRVIGIKGNLVSAGSECVMETKADGTTLLQIQGCIHIQGRSENLRTKIARKISFLKKTENHDGCMPIKRNGIFEVGLNKSSPRNAIPCSSDRRRSGCEANEIPDCAQGNGFNPDADVQNVREIGAVRYKTPPLKEGRLLKFVGPREAEESMAPRVPATKGKEPYATSPPDAAEREFGEVPLSASRTEASSLRILDHIEGDVSGKWPKLPPNPANEADDEVLFMNTPVIRGSVLDSEQMGERWNE